MSTWCVLHVRPRCEKKLVEHCHILGAERYLPLRSETKIYQRRKVTVEKPVFPGYVFVGVDRVQRLGLLKTNLIVRILETEDEAALLNELDQVRKALQVDPSLGADAAIAHGRAVRITGGPFMGIEGWVEEVRGHNKVRLNVDMIGRAIVVEVAREYLEPIDL
jgi:transcriptional antiterminator RfaH